MRRSASSFGKIASNLYQSIHQQLSVYAVATVVALLSVLALAPPSQAKIVYTKANVVLWCQTKFCDKQYNLDLNHDGVTDFVIKVTFFVAFVCNSSRQVGELPASGNSAIGSGGYATALMQGAPIGHSQQFRGGEGTMAFYDVIPTCQASYGGPWYSVHFPVTAYLGLRFRLNGRNHYGWAKLTVEQASYAKLTGYAYETIAGKSIIAGQTKGATDDSANEDFGSGASLTVPLPTIRNPWRSACWLSPGVN